MGTSEDLFLPIRQIESTFKSKRTVHVNCGNPGEQPQGMGEITGLMEMSLFFNPGTEVPRIKLVKYFPKIYCNFLMAFPNVDK